MTSTSTPSSNINTRYWFWLFATAHLLVWTFASWLSRGNPPFDSIEGVVWGNQWQWGYDKHPPLAPWITAFTARIVHNIDLSIYLLGALSSVICFWAIWRLAQKILNPVNALLSVVLLDGIYYYNVAATQFNPNVLMLPIWALLTLTFYNSLQTQKLRDWLLVGLLAGLALITKYESVLLLGMMGLVTLTTPEGRRSFSKAGIYCAIILALAIITPNILWLIDHQFIPFTYTTERLNSYHLEHWPAFFKHIYYPSLYIAEQFAAVLPVLLLFLVFWRCPRESGKLNNFDYWFLILMGAGPFIAVGLIALVMGVWIHSLWAFPFFSLLGILLFAWRRPIINEKLLKRFAKIFIIFFFLVAIVRSLLLIAGPYLTHRTNAAHFPGHKIANEITTRWNATYHQRLPYVAGYRTIVEHIAAYSSDAPIPYFDWDVKQSAWVNESDLKKAGGAFVWFAANDQSVLPAAIAERFPNAIPQKILIVQHLTGANMEPVYIGVAFLPPE